MPVRTLCRHTHTDGPTANNTQLCCFAALHWIEKDKEGRSITKLSYASQAWSGFIFAADLQRLNAFLRRSIRQGFCSGDLTDITVIFDAADETLFCKILSDRNHLLAPLLPNEVCTPYHLRPIWVEP